MEPKAGITPVLFRLTGSHEVCRAPSCHFLLAIFAFIVKAETACVKAK